MEIYKDVVGYEGLYWVSNLGNIKTENWRNSKRTAILRPAKDERGYFKVALQKDGKLKTYRVHRIVALAFINAVESKPQVNHINGIKTDNRAENLEWCNNSENQLHAYKLGLIPSKKGMPRTNWDAPKGQDVATSILKDFQVLEIRKRFKKRICTREMLGNEFGVSAATIKDIVLRKSWKHL